MYYKGEKIQMTNEQLTIKQILLFQEIWVNIRTILLYPHSCNLKEKDKKE